MLLLIVTLSAGLFVFSISVAIASFANREKIRVAQRIEAIGGHEERILPSRPKKQLKRRITVSKAFAEQLLSAGIRMRPEEFLTFWIAAVLFPGAVLMLMRANPITMIAVIALGVSIPPLLVARARKKRIILFEKQLGDSLLMVGNCLRSGLTFLQAITIVSKEMPDPIAREFSRFIKEIQLGSNLDEAFAKMVLRVPSTDLMLLVSAVQIQRQAGGNLLEILDNISDTIKERLKLKDDIRVMTSSGRISSLVVGMLPVVIAVMLMVINPNYIQTFFKSSLGISMLVTAGVMEIVGFLVIKKTITIKY